MDWFQLFAPPICYLLFHWQFFRSAENALRAKRTGFLGLFLTFAVNYGVFFLLSVLEFHLVVNWLVVLFLLVSELFLFHRKFAPSFLLSLLGTQLGLSFNIFFRSLVALILNVPLTVFDNNIASAGNMKIYPVLLGFLFGAAVFFAIRKIRLWDRITPALADRGNLLFLIALLSVLYAYLCVNLTVYYIEENSLVLKLWSMKSAVFVILGQYLAVSLSVKIGRIAEYRNKKRETLTLIAAVRNRESELTEIASTDPMTGCRNRSQAAETLREAAKGARYCLCFADLDRLKKVNDEYGHEAGDRFILCAASVLKEILGENDRIFRYGGDEFLLFLSDVNLPEAEARMRRAETRLEEEKRNAAYEFPMSFCFGCAESGEGADGAELIRAADERMYEMKQRTRSEHASEPEKLSDETRRRQ